MCELLEPSFTNGVLIYNYGKRRKIPSKRTKETKEGCCEIIKKSLKDFDPQSD